ncbi:MAG: Zn-ribbon domain-containing OB-fold protein [Hyphomonadaceae bacterium]|nr:Zn-ribbon domain-containing OB-fold protein [Hyphomonadaceae bacterium]
MDDPGAVQTGAIRPDPVVTIDSKMFWDGCDREELIIQQCGQCQTMHHPPRPMCPKCHAIDMRGVKMSGKGTVYSWTMPIHPAPYGFNVPPIVALIDLEGGARILSNVVGIDPMKMKVGLKVMVEFEPTSGGHKVPVFRVTSKVS